MGLTSGLGRLITGRVADLPKVNRIYLQQISFLLIGVGTMLLPIVTHFYLLIAIALIMGICDGCFISLLGPIAFQLCGHSGASQAIGCLLGLASIPLTVGPYVAGKSPTLSRWKGCILHLCAASRLKFSQRANSEVRLTLGYVGLRAFAFHKCGCRQAWCGCRQAWCGCRQAWCSYSSWLGKRRQCHDKLWLAGVITRYRTPCFDGMFCFWQFVTAKIQIYVALTRSP